MIVDGVRDRSVVSWTDFEQKELCSDSWVDGLDYRVNRKIKVRYLWSFGESRWSFIERVSYHYKEAADETWSLGAATSSGVG